MTASNVSVNPNRLSLEQAAKLLSAAGSREASIAALRKDLEAGSPANGDGTINLIHYCAWLAKEMGRGD
jgi:hypothetical protein